LEVPESSDSASFRHREARHSNNPRVNRFTGYRRENENGVTP
jgi:hypothetical protein